MQADFIYLYVFVWILLHLELFLISSFNVLDVDFPNGLLHVQQNCTFCNYLFKISLPFNCVHSLFLIICFCVQNPTIRTVCCLQLTLQLWTLHTCRRVVFLSKDLEMGFCLEAFVLYLCFRPLFYINVLGLCFIFMF